MVGGALHDKLRCILRFDERERLRAMLRGSEMMKKIPDEASAVIIIEWAEKEEKSAQEMIAVRLFFSRSCRFVISWLASI